MIENWIVYVLVVGVAVAAAGRAAEEVCRAARLPVRFVWLVAMGVTLALAIMAPLRGSGPMAAYSTIVVTDPGGTVPSVSDESMVAPGAAAFSQAIAVLSDAVRRPAEAIASRAPRGWGGTLVTVWVGISLVLLALGASTLIRYRAMRRRWPIREVAGERVRVSPAAGPAVLGIVRPEIIIPEWLLRTSPDEQRIAVLHEREHLRARDPLTLFAGSLAVALVPWNPVFWWMANRLRLCVELDCDARVIRGGVGPREYGSMLIDVAGRGTGLAPAIAAFAGSRSTLERRLVIMTKRLPRVAAGRAAGFTGIAIVILLAACKAELPTTAEIERMDVAAAEDAMTRMRLLNGEAGEARYFLDGAEITAEEARSIPQDQLARIEITRGAEPQIHLRSRDGAAVDARAVPEDQLARIEITRGAESQTQLGSPDGAAEEARSIAGDQLVEIDELPELKRAVERMMPEVQRHLNPSGTAESRSLSFSPVSVSKFDGLFLIDGTPAEPSAMQNLRPDRVENIEIIKGPAAERLYDDPRATNGVIRVTTKGAPAQ